MSITFKMGGDVNMTSLQGYVTTTYADLVGCFGEPTCDGDGYKVDAEWIITFADGVVATIYNYKDGKNYCGEEGLDVEDIREWHVGGYGNTGVEGRVKECLNASRASKPPVSDTLRKLEDRSFEQVIAESRPLRKTYDINMFEFRNTLVDAQNMAVDLTKCMENPDGSVPRDKLIEYTVRASEASVLSKIIKAMDACKF